MELRHLRYFIAVAEELSVTKAAARLNMAQPPLSVQIQKLEAEIGAKLFLRNGRHIELNEAGRVFLEHARETLAHGDRAVALTQRAARGEVGDLTIGYNTVAEFKVFPKIIPMFRKRWPDVQLTYREFGTSQQFAALHRDEVDVAFVWLPFPSDDFDLQELTEVAFEAAIPAKHRLVSAVEVSIKDLSKVPLIVVARTVDPQTYSMLGELFTREGAILNVAAELNSTLSMLNFVAMGSGCALVPDYFRNVPRRGVVYKPLRSPALVKTVAIAKKKGKRGLAEMFFELTVSNFRGD